ncbi:MAG: MBL fold metallo-hydrolase [Myxococcota bacterium]|nr:MBL fold metallo-hydrolase [Myxococcota bacterium]
MDSHHRARLPALLCLISAIACQQSAPADSGTEPVTQNGVEDDVNACIDGEIPLGEGHPAPAANCDDPISSTAAAIQQSFFAAAAAQLSLRAELLDPNVINVILCGTGTPVPSERTQACTAVFVGGKFLLFDAGDGASRSIERLQLPLADLEALFLTHFHSDHIAGVGEVISRSWILGRDAPLTVYGGNAIERIVHGFNQIYAVDDAYREAHHGADHFPVDVARARPSLIPDPGVVGQVVYEQDGVKVSAFAVDHAPVEPALGYRVEYKGKVVAISGDTLATEGLSNLSQDADILVSDVMNKAWIEETECALSTLPLATRGADIFRDIRTYHIDVSDLGQTAADAGVRTLMLTHLVPTPADSGQAETLFASPVAESFTGDIQVGTDGDRMTLVLEE